MSDISKALVKIISFFIGLAIVLAVLGVPFSIALYISSGLFVLLLVIVFISSPSKKTLLEQQEREILEKEEKHRELIEKVTTIVEKHSNSLARERTRLIYQDAYGNEIHDKWNRDGIDYFYDNVLLIKLDFEERELCKEYDVEIKFIISDAAWDAEKEMKKSLTFDYTMTGLDFERLCQKTLEDCGWEVKTTKKSGDQGVDLLATYGDVKVAIQCKKSSSPVGNKAVQEIVSGAKHYQSSHPVVVTNSTFTNSASSLAQTNGVTLFHYSELQELRYRLLPYSDYSDRDLDDRNIANDEIEEPDIEEPDSNYLFLSARDNEEKGNYEEAAADYLKAAEGGDHICAFFIAQLYEEGKGVKQDGLEAARWYRVAAENGMKWATYCLGKLYDEGLGVTQDNIEAYFWYSIASIKGVTDAPADRARVGQTLSADEIQKANRRAHKWFKKH